MKLLLSLISVLIISGSINAQNSEYSAANEGWMVDINKAYEKSEETGKPIMANFTGSDWCIWCKRLTASVFSTEKFKNWADENVVLLELDFPKRTQIPAEIKRQNASLQQAFNVRGYPTVWVFYLDKNDDSKNYKIQAVGKTGYRSSVDQFITEVDEMIKKNRNP